MCAAPASSRRGGMKSTVRKRPAAPKAMKRAMEPSSSGSESSDEGDDDDDGEPLVKKGKSSACRLPKGDPPGVAMQSGAELASTIADASVVVCMGRVGKAFGRLVVRVDEAYKMNSKGLWAEGTILEVSESAKQ